MAIVKQAVFLFLLALILTGCDDQSSQTDTGVDLNSNQGSSSGGGSNGGGSGGGSTTLAVRGMGVKGPLVNASVSLYALGSGQPGFRGTRLAQGRTDANAQLQLDIDSSQLVEDIFIIEYRGGRELDGSSAVLPSLRTVITSRQILQGIPVYATPLTTVAVDATALRLNNRASHYVFTSRLQEMATMTKQAFGLDQLDDTIDLFTSSPVLTARTAPQDSLAYRASIEVFSAIMLKLQQASAANGRVIPADKLIPAMAEDILDGSLNQQRAGKTIADFDTIDADDYRNILQSNPDTLEVPGAGVAVSALNHVIRQEVALLGTQITPGPLQKPSLAAIDPAFSAPPPAPPAPPTPPATAPLPPPTPTPTPTTPPTNTPSAPASFKLVITWTAPTTREDGSPLLASDIDHYEIYYYQQGTAAGAGQTIRVAATDPSGKPVTRHNLQLPQPGRYYFAISCVDSGKRTSQLSNQVTVDLP